MALIDRLPCDHAAWAILLSLPDNLITATRFNLVPAIGNIACVFVQLMTPWEEGLHPWRSRFSWRSLWLAIQLELELLLQESMDCSLVAAENDFANAVGKDGILLISNLAKNLVPLGLLAFAISRAVGGLARRRSKSTLEAREAQKPAFMVTRRLGELLEAPLVARQEGPSERSCLYFTRHKYHTFGLPKFGCLTSKPTHLRTIA